MPYNCGASYSVDDTDNEEMAKETEKLSEGFKEVQTFIYHTIQWMLMHSAIIGLIW